MLRKTYVYCTISAPVRGLLGAIAKLCKGNLDGFFTLSYTGFMADKKTPKSNGSSTAREDRLKAALKVNMARRKAQAKARAGTSADGKQTGKSEG
ncbi:hypothetical protein [Parasedimentitalea psychrophila]|uniref:Uncharacterized protein n=1 Tax=Parasedimentitalea psychrophila TaxID=2997337 RepID=A0A9Y2L3M0_9RHOB|nr:hypothetical protein [Parasedimentitalea psychrophila]WIY27703.1 hypothetical protein QPJ95_10825 [Parasedimentitalea psychrophila]